MSKLQLLIIDPQVDFCEGGALEVKGAAADMRRLMRLINRRENEIDEIDITLDWHDWDHIAHPCRWVGRDGKNPAPFTLISLADVVGDNPVWRASNPEFTIKQIHYVADLELNGRNKLVIWNPHCIGGTVGATITPAVNAAVREFQIKTNKKVRHFFKGQNKNTEHYSAIRADVIDLNDRSTGVNDNLLTDVFVKPDILWVAGEAGSHCVAQTILDAVDVVGFNIAKKIVVITDCMSPVPGFENLQEEFFERMKAYGATLAKSTDL